MAEKIVKKDVHKVELTLAKTTIINKTNNMNSWSEC